MTWPDVDEDKPNLSYTFRSLLIYACARNHHLFINVMISQQQQRQQHSNIQIKINNDGMSEKKITYAYIYVLCTYVRTYILL